MKFNVQAYSFNRKTGEQSGMGRTEQINTETNKLFFGMTTIMEIKEIYESFWNDLNPNSEDIVFVSKITFV